MSTPITTRTAKVSSPVSKVIGNFVMSTFSSVSLPMRMFTSEDEALAWLRGIVE